MASFSYFLVLFLIFRVCCVHSEYISISINDVNDSVYNEDSIVDDVERYVDSDNRSEPFPPPKAFNLIKHFNRYLSEYLIGKTQENPIEDCAVYYIFSHLIYRIVSSIVKQDRDVPAKKSQFHLLEVLNIFNQVKHK